MDAQPTTIHFLLNDRDERVEAPAGLLVLDFLRQQKRLVGTKEGCREGDCGACTVLVGELQGDPGSGRLQYRPMTSCLMPCAELAGKHLVTIEGLSRPSESADPLATLTPVQRAIVEHGATQCGFCTPGIVVSLTAMVLETGRPPGPDAVERALSGHLCRCTGYRSLRASGAAIGEATPNVGSSATDDEAWGALVEAGFLPHWWLDSVQRLREMAAEHHRSGAEVAGEIPSAETSATDVSITEDLPTVIAGGTDLYVQRGEDLPRVAVDVLDRHPEMRGIRVQGGCLHLGALTTFEELAEHPKVRPWIPRIEEHMHLVASWQVRTRATLGGNLMNASPIGDMTILCLALDAEVVLCRGEACRRQPLRTFYRGYKDLDRAPGELLTEIVLPNLDPETRVHFEKVSKRTCLDIATVNSASCLRLEDGLIADAGLAVGGVAPVPLRLEETAAEVRGKPLDRATVDWACAVAQEEISPISDVRGSAQYKRLLVRQQLIAHFTTLYPEILPVDDFLPTPSAQDPGVDPPGGAHHASP